LAQLPRNKAQPQRCSWQYIYRTAQDIYRTAQDIYRTAQPNPDVAVGDPMPDQRWGWIGHSNVGVGFD
jgi:hypothetical protein